MRFLKLVISICRSTGYLVHRSKKRIFRNIASHSQPFFIICSFFAFLVSPLKLTIQMSNFRKQGKFSPTRTSTLKMNFSEVDRFTFSFSNCKTNRLGVVWNIWRREIVKSDFVTQNQFGTGHRKTQVLVIFILVLNDLYCGHPMIVGGGLSAPIETKN